MAEYRPKGRGLERVLGTGALFSTAYGNVGSSIYYALGLVAIYAAGMTPVVFVIAGLIFAATAATYTEATTMYPEAGGSSSFARRAFNEFWSFFAAWGQMLTYIITVAISAFFVPHYLAVFWEPLSESPGDILAGIAVVVLLGAVNIFGVKESAGVNVFFAVLDFLTQVLLVIVGLVLVFDPELLVEQIDFGTVPTVSDFLIAIPVAMVAYTGIETISNMAEEARDYTKTIPRGMGLVVLAVVVIYAFLPAVALSAMPVVNGETVLAKPEDEGGTRAIRSSAWWRTWTSARSGAPPRSTWACWRPRSCSSPLTPGCSACPGSPTRWGSTGSCRRACARCTPSSAPRTWRS